MGAEIASRGVQPLVFLVLARLLTPEDFGVVAAAVMVFGSAIGPGITGALIDYGVDFPNQMLPISLFYVGAALLATYGIIRYRPTLGR